RGTLLSDVIDGAEGDGVLKAAFDAIREEGRGVLVYLRRSYGPTDALGLRPPPQEADNALRELGLGAQILTDLGLQLLRLLTREPRRIVGLESYGLVVDDQVVIGKPARPRRSQARPLRRVK